MVSRTLRGHNDLCVQQTNKHQLVAGRLILTIRRRWRFTNRQMEIESEQMQMTMYLLLFDYFFSLSVLMVRVSMRMPGSFLWLGPVIVRFVSVCVRMLDGWGHCTAHQNCYGK